MEKQRSIQSVIHPYLFQLDEIANDDVFSGVPEKLFKGGDKSWIYVQKTEILPKLAERVEKIFYSYFSLRKFEAKGDFSPLSTLQVEPLNMFLSHNRLVQVVPNQFSKLWILSPF